jgi:hypothetical protein
MRRLGFGACIVALALILTACGGGGGARSTTTTPTTTTGTATTGTAPPAGPLGPELIPIPDAPPLGPVNTHAYPGTIDGIECQVSEQAVYHIHAHLTLFVDGKPRQVPYGIGIAPPIQLTNTAKGTFVSGGTCFYWLHTHAADGILHIESPTQTMYTLGQFFDVWGQPLAPGQVGAATGALTTYVNGQQFGGNPRDIPLNAHSQIQLDVGTVVAPQHIDWSLTGL